MGNAMRSSQAEMVASTQGLRPAVRSYFPLIARTHSVANEVFIIDVIQLKLYARLCIGKAGHCFTPDRQQINVTRLEPMQ